MAAITIINKDFTPPLCTALLWNLCRKRDLCFAVFENKAETACFSPLRQSRSPSLSRWGFVSVWAEAWECPAATHFLPWTKKSNRKLLLHKVRNAVKTGHRRSGPKSAKDARSVSKSKCSGLEK